MEYVIVALLLVIAWAVTRPVIKEKQERKANVLLERVSDYYLHPKDPNIFPLSSGEIRWLVRLGKLPSEFLNRANSAP